ncbi:hypothetical protein Tco_0415851 [Tanacetum coccineum]
MSWFSRCSWCGGPFNGGNCRRCTNVSFGDEFVRNPDPISYDETPNFSYPPPQPQYETYSCELCGKDSHYSEIVSQIPPSIAIIPILPTLETEDSLIMGNEELSTIPEKESDEVIKSSVKDLVPILKNIKSKDSYVSNLDKPALLVIPLFEANEDECFDPGGEIDEIDAFLDIDVSTDIKNGYHDSEGDIIYLESLLINDTIPNLPPRIAPDYEDSRARRFVHRSLDLPSFACLCMGIRYPRSY